MLCVLVNVIAQILDYAVARLTQIVSADSAHTESDNVGSRQHHADDDQAVDHRGGEDAEKMNVAVRGHVVAAEDVINQRLGHKGRQKCQNGGYDRDNDRDYKDRKLGLYVLYKSCNDLLFALAVDALDTGRGERSAALGADRKLFFIGGGNGLDARFHAVACLVIVNVENDRITKSRYTEGIAENVLRLVLSLQAHANKSVAVHTLGEDLVNVGKGDTFGHVTCRVIGYDELVCGGDQCRVGILSVSGNITHNCESDGIVRTSELFNVLKLCIR